MTTAIIVAFASFMGVFFDFDFWGDSARNTKSPSQAQAAILEA